MDRSNSVNRKRNGKGFEGIESNGKKINENGRNGTTGAESTQNT